MKAFKTIESFLIWITLLAFGGAFVTYYTESISSPLLLVIAALLFVWGFRLWIKMKSNEENSDHDAFLWLEALAYGSIAVAPLLALNSPHVRIPNGLGGYIINLYIWFPVSGIILALILLRKDYKP